LLALSDDRILEIVKFGDCSENQTARREQLLFVNHLYRHHPKPNAVEFTRWVAPDSRRRAAGKPFVGKAAAAADA
jgi:hypothetical protein